MRERSPQADGAVAGPPAVTVLLPVYNGMPWIDETLHAVRAQTFADLDILVIDDGSTDGTADCLARHAAADRRVRIVARENRGLVATLNEGLALARGRYIARIDADDVYEPRCIERQVRYLDANPAVVLLGVTLFQRRGMRWLNRGIHGREFVRLALMFSNPVGHPGVMLRRQALVDHDLHYDPGYFLVEDHDLWCRLARVGEVDVLPEPLVYYRRHPGTLSQRHYREQVRAQRRIVCREFQALAGVALSDALEADDAAWCGTFAERLFSSRFFRDSPKARQRMLHVLYQDYSARFGPGVARDYLARCGWRGVLSGRWFGLWFLLRVARRWFAPPPGVNAS